MNYMHTPHFSLVEHQEKQLKRARITAVLLALLLVIAFATIFWLTMKLVQTNQSLEVLLSDARHLLEEKNHEAEELSRVKQKLAETEAQFEESFNTLYPAFVAVENIRYIGIDSQTYHYFSCSEFSTFATYTAHNREYCDKLGYIPCPICCSD